MGKIIPFPMPARLAEVDSDFVYEFMETKAAMLSFRISQLDEVEDEEGLREWIREVKEDVAGWPE